MFKKRYKLDAPTPKWSRSVVFGAVGVLVLLVAATIGVRMYYESNLKPIGNTRSQVVVIEQGATVPEVASLLKEKELIRSEAVFSWYVRSKNAGDKIQAGTYEIEGSLGVPEIVSILTKGEVTTDLITIVPGKRIDQIQKAFIDSGFDEVAVRAAFDINLYKDHVVLADVPEGVTTLEGLLYPDSFQRDNNTTPEQIVRQSLDEMQKQLTPDVRAAFAQQSLTVYQGLILASIVEKEVPDAEDRPIAAQVFLNRLAIDMPLATDASDEYGSIMAGQSGEANFAVNFDSPYNTRMYKGLPPTPIATAERTAIQAVAKPAGTTYLYFVAGNDCVTRFSNTLAEHEAFIAQHGVGCQ